MISVNSTVKFTFRNTGTFFGVHVSPEPLDLSYSQIAIASGTVSINTNVPFSFHFQITLPIPVLIYASSFLIQVKKFYQSRRSQRTVTVSVIGDKIPLYGSGASISSSTGTTLLPVPLKLDFLIKSRAYVLGKLVKPKFNRRVGCTVTFDPKKLNVAIALKNCTYS